MWKLGCLMLRGQGTKKDEKGAFQWLQKSADKGDAGDPIPQICLLLANRCRR